MWLVPTFITSLHALARFGIISRLLESRRCATKKKTHTQTRTKKHRHTPYNKYEQVVSAVLIQHYCSVVWFGWRARLGIYANNGASFHALLKWVVPCADVWRMLVFIAVVGALYNVRVFCILRGSFVQCVGSIVERSHAKVMRNRFPSHQRCRSRRECLWYIKYMAMSVVISHVSICMCAYGLKVFRFCELHVSF